MKQGTQEWLEWRRTRIGASEAAIVMGISPWKTPYRLWLEKTQRVSLPPPSSAMSYGNRMEGAVREQVEQDFGELYIPTTVTHPDFDWMIASLDGLSGDGKTILEIKTCQLPVFLRAEKGMHPDYYMAQVQQQLLCTPSAECVLVAYKHQDRLTVAEVVPDYELQERILKSASSFYYDHLLKDVPPECSSKDYILIHDNIEYELAALEYKDKHAKVAAIKRELKEAEAALSECKDRLLEHTDGGNSIGAGLSIEYRYTKGLVDYSKIPELEGVELDKHRKPATTRIYITIMKDDKNGSD